MAEGRGFQRGGVPTSCQQGNAPPSYPRWSDERFSLVCSKTVCHQVLWARLRLLDGVSDQGG